MLAETRRKMLLDLINRRGFATLEDLVKALGVSESTIRRDLEALDQLGLIKRTHGGAVCADEMRLMPAHEEREFSAADEKRAIGRAVGAMIEDEETVLLDGGTTTLEVARALVGRPIQVVTNSLPIAQLLASSQTTDLILVGGYVYPRTGVAMGPIATATLEGIRVGRAILGAGGITGEGVFNSNSVLVDTQRQMMRCGQEVVVVADHSKFGRQSLSKLCRLSEVDRFVTDAGLSETGRQMLERAGARFEVVPLAGEPGSSRPEAATTNQGA